MLNNADNLNVKYESSVWGNDPVPCSLFAVGHVWARGESAQVSNIDQNCSCPIFEPKGKAFELFADCTWWESDRGSLSKTQLWDRNLPPLDHLAWPGLSCWWWSVGHQEYDVVGDHVYLRSAHLSRWQIQKARPRRRGSSRSSYSRPRIGCSVPSPAFFIFGGFFIVKSRIALESPGWLDGPT